MSKVRFFELNRLLSRVEICEVYWLLEYDWNFGGVLQERDSNVRRKESTGVQLHRIGFIARQDLKFGNMTIEQKLLYTQHEVRIYKKRKKEWSN